MYKYIYIKKSNQNDDIIYIVKWNSRVHFAKLHCLKTMASPATSHTSLHQTLLVENCGTSIHISLERQKNKLYYTNSNKT